MWPRALRLDGSVRDPNALHMMMLEHVYQRAAEFDVLHFHLDYYPFSLFSRQATPFVTTLHGRLDLPEHQPVFDTFSSVPVVSISNAQRRPLPQANWVRTVLSRPAGGSADAAADQAVLFRLPRPHRAGEGHRPRHPHRRSIAACRSRSPPRSISADQDYYDEKIKPLMQSANVEFIGEINDRQKPDFLSGAIGAAVPIDWPEPFGLVMIEAMACGTPVIAFNRGSVPEVIEDGAHRLYRRGRSTAPSAPSTGSGICRAKRSGSVSKSASPRGAWRRIISASIAAYATRSRRICGWSPTTRRRCSTRRTAVAQRLRWRRRYLSVLHRAASPASGATPREARPMRSRPSVAKADGLPKWSVT